MTRRRYLVSALVALILTFGCRPSVPLEPTRGTVEAPAVARVTLTEVDGDILKLSVLNLSSAPMVVMRDQVVLITPHGERQREPGGVTGTYNLPPGTAHDLNVRFDLSGLSEGDVVELRARARIARARSERSECEGRRDGAPTVD